MNVAEGQLVHGVEVRRVNQCGNWHRGDGSDAMVRDELPNGESCGKHLDDRIPDGLTSGAYGD